MLNQLLLTTCLLATSLAHTFEVNGFTNPLDVKHCDERGGCDCDCSWANSDTCGADDGSCCYGCCCSSAPNPPKPPAPSGQTLYCPSAGDLTVAYGSPQLMNQGWAIHGGGAAASKASFNLLGGYVEFDIEFAGVPRGVNANIYSISPGGIGSGFMGDHYCDGADNDQPWCVEVDWIESNGNCGGATHLHTRPGPGNNGCTAWGCGQSYTYNGRSNFHMRVEFDADGKWTTIHDGQVIGPYNLDPTPQGQDWSALASQYSEYGAVIYSSQWTGWVPVDQCGTNPGDLNSAYFAVKNLKVYGSVVQGPTPTRC